MLPYRNNMFGTIVLAVFFLALLGYALFELRGTFVGPRITIDETEALVHDPYVVVQGKVERITVLTLNGAAIPVTEAGEFKEPVLLSPGYNVVDIEATDAARRTAKKHLTIVYEPVPVDSIPSAPEATSTGPSAMSEPETAEHSTTTTETVPVVH